MNKAAQNIQKIINKAWTGSFVENGITYNITSDVSVSAVEGVTSAGDVTNADPTVQNVVEMINGPLSAKTNSAADFKPPTPDSRSPDGTSPDTARWNIKEALNQSPEPAHEFGHLLGYGHLDPSISGSHLMLQLTGMAPHATPNDYSAVFANVLLNHRLMPQKDWWNGKASSTFTVRVPPHP